MKGFMVMLLICSVTMSAAALFYMAATPLLAKHYSVKARYYSWLVIIIGLIIPFRPKFGNALVRVNVPDSPAVSVIRLGNGTSVPAAVPAGNAVPSALPNILVADSGGIVADRNDRISGLSCNQTSPLFEAGVTLER